MNKHALVVAVVVAALATGAPAHAKESQRVAYATVLSVFGTIALGCLAAGTALHFAAPDADTLQTYKREDSASTDLLVAGTLVSVPTLLFAIVGASKYDLSSEPRVSLAPTPGGFAFAVGGRF